MKIKNIAWAIGIYVAAQAALYSKQYSDGGKWHSVPGKPGPTRRTHSEQYQRGSSQAGYGALAEYDE